MVFNIDLRLMSQAQIDTESEPLDCPVVFTGTHEQCTAYARKNGYEFKVVRQFLFGGYFVNKNGDCLLPT